MEKLEGVSLGAVGYMLRDCAWCEVQKAWMMEAERRSKLGMAKLRGGTAELRVETGRWIGLEREDRICGQCGLREVENVEHFVLRCDGLVREKEVLMKGMT